MLIKELLKLFPNLKLSSNAIVNGLITKPEEDLSVFSLYVLTELFQETAKEAFNDQLASLIVTKLDAVQEKLQEQDFDNFVPERSFGPALAILGDKLNKDESRDVVEEIINGSMGQPNLKEKILFLNLTSAFMRSREQAPKEIKSAEEKIDSVANRLCALLPEYDLITHIIGPQNPLMYLASASPFFRNQFRTASAYWNELNGQIAAIGKNLQLMLKSTPEHQKYIEQITKAITKCDKVAQSYLKGFLASEVLKLVDSTPAVEAASSAHEEVAAPEGKEATPKPAEKVSSQSLLKHVSDAKADEASAHSNSADDKIKLTSTTKALA